MHTERPTPQAANRRKRSLRSLLIGQTILWHWVSSGVCLAGMLLFTVTGITLNHASEITADPAIETVDAVAPPELLTSLNDLGLDGAAPIPAPLSDWFAEQFQVDAARGSAEWSDEEVYVSLPKPGGDAWISLDRISGEAMYESTDRGWISYLNDLHKGRHTGPAWSLFIDVLAVGCLVFTLSGLILLYTHASKRPATWPLVIAGLLAPVLILMLYVHG